MDSADAMGERYLTEIWDDVEQPGLTAAALDTFRKTKHLCESPIEVMMLAGLIGTPFGYADSLNQVIRHADLEKTDTAAITSHIIVPQMEIPQFSYRTDFFVSLYTAGYRRIGLFIECDGHDFHERTKEQAARDRKRDRDLQGLGINILRFTGSELHRDFDECMAQLDLFGSDLIEREWVRNGREVWGYDKQRRNGLGKLLND